MPSQKKKLAQFFSTFQTESHFYEDLNSDTVS